MAQMVGWVEYYPQFEEGVDRMKQNDDPTFRGTITADDLEKAKKALPLEPRPFQREVFEKAKDAKFPLIFPRPRGRATYIGVDMAQAGGDRTVIAQATVDKKGKMFVYFDEYAELPNYKWYRNPFKWFKWRRLMRKLEKQVEKYKL